LLRKEMSQLLGKS